jgi:4-amino-4-deoxy-L-arabinose transferase-like glycosyltransferase
LAVLAKLPAIFAMSVLALPILSKNISLLPKISIVIISITIFSIAYWWYFVWDSYLFITYGYQLYFPFNFKEGLKSILPFWDKTLEQFYFSAFQSFIALGMFLYGLYYCLKNKLRLHLLILGVSLPVFIAFIIKTGNVFALHSYYIIPFVPVMAIIAGIGLSKIPLKIYPWLLTFITIEAIANQQNDFFIKEKEKYKLTLEQDINKSIPKNEKIAMGGNTGPQFLYFAHRKGWGLSVKQTLDTAYMNYLINHDYKYLVLIKKEFTELPKYRQIAANKDLLIYELK